MAKRASLSNRLRWTAFFLRFVDRLGQATKRKVGLSLTQVRILLYATCFEGRAMTSIARSLNIKAPATTAAVNGLEDLGFVRREVSSDDGRSVGLYVTKLGLTRIPKLLDAAEEAYATSIELYGEEVVSDVIRVVLRSEPRDFVRAVMANENLTFDDFCKRLNVERSLLEGGRMDRLVNAEKVASALQVLSALDAEYGLGIKAAVILRSISACGGEVSLKELRSMLLMKPVAMTAQVNYLEDEGLITRSLDPSDRRLTLLTITEEGSELALGSRDAFIKCFDNVFPELAKIAPPDWDK